MLLFFNDTATTKIYTLSLHDALPISPGALADPALDRVLATDSVDARPAVAAALGERLLVGSAVPLRSEEHTPELQSRQYTACRLLLEIKKTHTSQVGSEIALLTDPLR